MPVEPFFRSPPRQNEPLRRMLLLSYHFPPGTAVGALRWQKMSRYAAERGWGVDVVTLEPMSSGPSDLQALEQLAPGLRVYGARQPRLLRERVEHLAWRMYTRVRARPKFATVGLLTS